MSTTVGVVGVSAAGEHVIGNLLEHGTEVLLAGDVDSVLDGTLLDAVQVVASPKALGERADVIFVLVRNEIQAHRVLFEEDGVLVGDHGDLLVVLPSEIPTEFCREVDEHTPSTTTVVDTPLRHWRGLFTG